MLVLAAATSLLALGLPSGAVAEEGQQRSEWLIGFDGPPDRGQLERIERSGGEVVRGLRGLPVVLAELPERSVEQIEDGEGVRYVEPNGQVRALGDELPWGVERVDAPGAWTAGQEADAWGNEDGAGDGVTVAVLDSGITHDDAFDHLTMECTNIAEDAEDGDCEDVYGHGTHVAGTIAAAHESRTPGIAAGVDLHDVKVLDDDGVGTHADIAEGILEASAPDREGDVGQADVINMSLGGGSNNTVESAVEAAAERGVLLVAAAGNGGNPGGNNDSVSYPANYDEVIAVAATDEDDERATFSSTGPGVEIAAPGVDIPSTWPEDGDHDFDCEEDCDYHNGSGTSMASPHVAGAAALALAADPDRSAEEVRTDLTATAEELDASDNEVGAGLLDAAALLEWTLADEDDGDNGEDDEHGAITGQVTDADTEEAIRGATVTAEGGGERESTTTTDEGSYKLELPEGDYTVTAEADDYEPATSDAEVEAGETSKVDFELASKPDDDEESEGDVSISSIDYDTRGGRDNDRHLDITVSLVDENGEPVTDTHLEIEIDRDDGAETWTFSDDTGDQGSVRFTINNHDPGCYQATVTDVGTHDWDGKTPEDNTHGCEE